MLWYGRINWLGYGFAPISAVTEQYDRVENWMRDNRRPSDPPQVTEQFLAAEMEWHLRLREVAQAVTLDYPPTLAQCILIVDSAGEVVAAISKDRNRELHLTGRG